MVPLVKERFDPTDFTLLELFALEALFHPVQERRQMAERHLGQVEISYDHTTHAYRVNIRGTSEKLGKRLSSPRTISQAYINGRGIALMLNGYGDEKLILCPTPQRYGSAEVDPGKVRPLLITQPKISSQPSSTHQQ